MIVDSCIDQRSESNPVLGYLDSIGVDAKHSVKLVVASHAHDDHIAGLSQIVERCEDAAFICSAALTKNQFFALLEADEEISALTKQSAYSEFRRINEILSLRASGRKRWPAYNWAIADRPLYTRPSDDVKAGVLVTSLSPSDESVTRSLEFFDSLMPTSGEQPRRVAITDPNTLTCVLWVEVGKVRLLLGGDLLRGPGGGCGWNAILSSPFRPKLPASAFKVPHHGAPNAHHQDVWAQMLDDNALAVLTPFRRLKEPRPTDADQRRICAITDAAYITADPRRPNPAAKVKRMAADLSNSVHRIHEEGRAGHIRARFHESSSTWKVELADPARPLCRA